MLFYLEATVIRLSFRRAIFSISPYKCKTQKKNYIKISFKYLYTSILAEKRSSVYIELLNKYKNVKETQQYAHICVIYFILEKKLLKLEIMCVSRYMEEQFAYFGFIH